MLLTTKAHTLDLYPIRLEIEMYHINQNFCRFDTESLDYINKYTDTDRFNKKDVETNYLVKKFDQEDLKKGVFSSKKEDILDLTCLKISKFRPKGTLLFTPNNLDIQSLDNYSVTSDLNPVIPEASKIEPAKFSKITKKIEEPQVICNYNITSEIITIIVLSLTILLYLAIKESLSTLKNET